MGRNKVSGALRVAQVVAVTLGCSFGAVAWGQVSPAKHASADVSGQSGPVQVSEVRYCNAVVEKAGAEKDLQVSVDAKSCRDALKSEPVVEGRQQSPVDRRGGRD